MEVSAAALFVLLWEGLADVLGTAATAALVRRAVSLAIGRYPELAALIIVREQLSYSYTLPSAWNEPSLSAPPALRSLAHELGLLLIELTGIVVVRHLSRISQLRESGIVFPTQAEQP